MAYILEDCEATMLISSSKFAPQLEACGQLESLRHIILIDEGTTDHVPFDKLLASASSVSLPPISPQAVALIIYTSGTTGHPKGALLSHNNLMANVISCSKVMKLSRRDRFLVFLPLFHSFTFTVTLLLPCYLGARIILLEGIQREEIRRSIIRRRVSILVGIPTVYHLLSQVELGRLARWLNPVRVYVSGGAPLSAEVLEEFQRKFRRPLLEGYGLSEASPVVSINPPHKVKPGSVGLPIPGVEVKVVDKQGRPVATNEIGELLIRGDNVMQGYLNRPQASKRALADGWLHTGDMARLDDEGYIYIVDRKKEMLIIHGCNVYPREIEDVLYQHPQVAEAAVVGLPDAHRGEIPKAVIVPKEGERVEEREIKKYCRRFLAPYKVPRVVEFRDSLPKTATGKVMKRML
jgi:long-chain acyl-CoA synthetase